MGIKTLGSTAMFSSQVIKNWATEDHLFLWLQWSTILLLLNWDRIKETRLSGQRNAKCEMQKTLW